MSWKDDIRKEMPKREYYETLDAMINTITEQTIPLIENYTRLGFVIRAQKDVEALDLLQPVLTHLKGANMGMIKLLDKLDENAKRDLQTDIFDEDAWRREMT